MRVGITLPTFEPTSSVALATARAAERAGIDGVFVFDHFWRGATRSRPALSMYPVLGGVMATTRRVMIGSLVARLGYLPDRAVADSFLSLHQLARGRLVAALGIGDSISAAENAAYGIAWPSLEERRTSLVGLVGELTAAGIECWVGATAPATIEIARAGGATVNLWDVDLERFQAEAARGPTSWAGPFPKEAGPAADQLIALRDAGATWAIWGWPRSVDLVTDALRLAGLQSRKG